MFRSILLVDDHPAILEALRNVVTARYPGAVCRTAAATSEVRWLLSREQPDLAILDISIGGGNGLDLIHLVRASSPNVRILIYTLHHEKQFGLAALRAGAHGYLTKDRPLAELVQALSRLEAGQRYISGGLVDSLATAVTEDTAPALSTREAQTLRMLAGGRAMKEIAGDLGVSIKTVSTYRARILEKLRLTTTAELIRYAVSNQL